MVRRNKYNRKVTEIDGIRFDSKKEAQRYEVLSALQKRGKIEGLALQQRFTLIPSQKTPFGTLRAVEYVADFVYRQDGKTVIEDVKGYRGGVPYSLFKIKKKLMYWVHGLWVEEI